MSKPQILSFLLAAVFLPLGLCGGSEIKLENLGSPIQAGIFSIYGYTLDAGGKATVWTRYRESNGDVGLLGIDAETGRSTYVDLAGHGDRNLLLRVYDNKVYGVQGGRPARVVEYDPATGKQQETRLPVNSNYFVDASADITPDGKLFLGTYPEAELVWMDLKTRRTGTLGRVSGDDRQKYILYVLADDGGAVYFTVGLHHPEVWSYQPETGRKKQILPEKYAGLTARAAILYSEGKVYSWIGKDFYRCTPEGMEPVKAIPGVQGEPRHRVRCDVEYPKGKRSFLALGSDSRLTVKDLESGNTTLLETDVPNRSVLVYSIRPERDGRVWVGGFSPPSLASFKHGEKSPAFSNYGRQGSGDTQVYDTLDYRGWIYVSSYGKGYIDEVNLSTKKYTPVLSLFTEEEQERIFRFVPAADGKIYAPTMPIKGILGGGILEWEPEAKRHRFHRHAVRNQSIRDLCVTADPALLFGATDIHGGSSSIPVEKEAKIFLWDIRNGKTVWETAPVPGEKIFMGAHRLAGNLVWTVGTYSRTLVVFDTAARKIVKTIKIPPSGRGIALHAIGSAPDRWPHRAFVVGGDAVFDVDTVSGEVKILLQSPVVQKKFDPMFHSTHAETIHPDGTIYLGSGPELYRLKVE